MSPLLQTFANASAFGYGWTKSSTAAFGYVVGSRSQASGLANNAINKMSFATEVSASLAALSTAVGGNSGSSNKGVAGYAYGGFTSTGNRSGWTKISYPSDTQSFTSSANTYGQGAGVTYLSTAGYFAGGSDYYNTYLSQFNKLTFSTDTRTQLTKYLSTPRQLVAGLSNPLTAGYFIGGDAGAGPLTAGDKFSYATETLAAYSGVTSMRNSGGVTNPGTFGYISGSGATVTTIWKIVYATDAWSTASPTLSVARANIPMYNNDVTAGYMAGGGNNTPLTTIDRITYATETRAALSSGLITDAATAAGFASNGV